MKRRTLLKVGPLAFGAAALTPGFKAFGATPGSAGFENGEFVSDVLTGRDRNLALFAIKNNGSNREFIYEGLTGSYAFGFPETWALSHILTGEGQVTRDKVMVQTELAWLFNQYYSDSGVDSTRYRRNGIILTGDGFAQDPRKFELFKDGYVFSVSFQKKFPGPVTTKTLLLGSDKNLKSGATIFEISDSYNSNELRYQMNKEILEGQGYEMTKEDASGFDYFVKHIEKPENDGNLCKAYGKCLGNPRDMNLDFNVNYKPLVDLKRFVK